MAKKPLLARPLYEYNPRQLAQIDDATLRKEYTKLRDIAQKRLQRLGQTEQGRQSAVYVSNFGAFPTIKKMGGRVNKYNLIKLARFVANPMSTVKGQKAVVSSTVKSLRASGITHVTKENIADYGAMMEYIRALGYDAMLYSLKAGKRDKVSLYGPEFFNELFETWQKVDNPEEAVLDAIDKRSKLEGIQGFNR